MYHLFNRQSSTSDSSLKKAYILLGIIMVLIMNTHIIMSQIIFPSARLYFSVGLFCVLGSIPLSVGNFQNFFSFEVAKLRFL